VARPHGVLEVGVVLLADLLLGLDVGGGVGLGVGRVVVGHDVARRVRRRYVVGAHWIVLIRASSERGNPVRKETSLQTHGGDQNRQELGGLHETTSP